MADPFPVPDEAQTNLKGQPQVSVFEGPGLEVSVTVKYGPEYDAPWLVVRGPRDEVAEFVGLEPGAKLSAFNAQVPKVSDHAHTKYQETNPKA